VAQFFIHFGGVGQSLGKLTAEDFAKAFPEPVKEDADGRFGGLQSGGGR